MGLLADELKAMCTGDPDRYLFAGWTYNKGQAILREAAKKLGLYWEAATPGSSSDGVGTHVASTSTPNAFPACRSDASVARCER
jgi:hypothetical protein